jgi:hypothetical protein
MKENVCDWLGDHLQDSFGQIASWVLKNKYYWENFSYKISSYSNNVFYFQCQTNLTMLWNI